MSSPGDNNEASAGSGGAGAPPEPNEANRAPDLTREYASPDIRVQWYASRCIHSAACIKALPQVFDPRHRPWVDIDAANADAIADAVLKCPTGALHFARSGKSSAETELTEVTITAVANGPYLLAGSVEIKNSSGRVLRKDNRVALCRCGKSGHMPFCDNTHRAIGFRSG